MTVPQILRAVAPAVPDLEAQMSHMIAVAFYLRTQNVMSGKVRELPHYEGSVRKQVERQPYETEFLRTVWAARPLLDLETAVVVPNGVSIMLTAAFRPHVLACPDPAALPGCWLAMFREREAYVLKEGWKDLGIAALASSNDAMGNPVLPPEVSLALTKVRALLF